MLLLLRAVKAPALARPPIRPCVGEQLAGGVARRRRVRRKMEVDAPSVANGEASTSKRQEDDKTSADYCKILLWLPSGS